MTRSTTALQEVQSGSVWRGSQAQIAVSRLCQDTAVSTAAEKNMDLPVFLCVFRGQIIASYGLCYGSSREAFFPESMIPPGGGGSRGSRAPTVSAWSRVAL